MFQAARLSWILLLCALAMLGGCGGAESRFASHMQRGEQYLANGVYDKASVEFRNALQIEPRNARARYLYGVVAEHRGDVRAALGSYQGAIDVEADSPDARAALGRLLTFGGAPERALPILEEGLAKHPDDPALLAARSAARLQLKNMDGALADAGHAVKVAPNDESAVALLAGLYLRQGQPDRALGLVESTVTRQPNSIPLRQVLASLYVATHQEAKSEEQLKKIVTLAPKELTYRYALANYYVRVGNVDGAEQVLSAAVQASPTDSQAKLALVDFIATHRSREQGEKTLREYVAREPDNDDLRLGLGTLLQRAGAAQDAIAAYDAIVAHDSRSAASLIARDRIAAIELARGHVPAAQERIAAVLEQNPRDADALRMRGDLALASGNPAAAIVDLRAVVRDQPNNLDVQRMLARAYSANGESALAEETLRAAMQSAPTDVSVRVDLAELLRQSGRAETAVPLLEEAVRQAPNDSALRVALVKAYLAKRDLPAARTAADDLKKLQPQAAVGAYLAGVVSQEQGRIDDSRREYEQALKLQPGATEALAAIVRLELAHGESAAALQRLRAIVAAEPQNALVQNLLAEALVATRAYPEAITQLTHAIALAPKLALSYRNLALANLRAENFAGATAAYEAGLEEIPYDIGLTAGLAEIHVQQGQPDKAIALYQALHSHDPHQEVASNNLAMLLVTHRTDRASLDLARDLTAGFANSQSGALLDTNGWVRLKLGDLNDALTALQRAASHAPDSSVIRYHLAMAELQAGERDKARSNLEAALAGSADFSGSAEARAALDRLRAGGRS